VITLELSFEADWQAFYMVFQGFGTALWPTLAE
jgi:hypothetical protein